MKEFTHRFYLKANFKLILLLTVSMLGCFVRAYAQSAVAFTVAPTLTVYQGYTGTAIPSTSSYQIFYVDGGSNGNKSPVFAAASPGNNYNNASYSACNSCFTNNLAAGPTDTMDHVYNGYYGNESKVLSTYAPGTSFIFSFSYSGGSATNDFYVEASLSSSFTSPIDFLISGGPGAVLPQQGGSTAATITWNPSSATTSPDLPYNATGYYFRIKAVNTSAPNSTTYSNFGAPVILQLVPITYSATTSSLTSGFAVVSSNTAAFASAIPNSPLVYDGEPVSFSLTINDPSNSGVYNVYWKQSNGYNSWWGGSEFGSMGGTSAGPYILSGYTGVADFEISGNDWYYNTIQPTYSMATSNNINNASLSVCDVAPAANSIYAFPSSDYTPNIITPSGGTATSSFTLTPISHNQATPNSNTRGMNGYQFAPVIMQTSVAGNVLVLTPGSNTTFGPAPGYLNEVAITTSTATAYGTSGPAGNLDASGWTAGSYYGNGMNETSVNCCSSTTGPSLTISTASPVCVGTGASLVWTPGTSSTYTTTATTTFSLYELGSRNGGSPGDNGAVPGDVSSFISSTTPGAGSTSVTLTVPASAIGANSDVAPRGFGVMVSDATSPNGCGVGHNILCGSYAATQSTINANQLSVMPVYMYPPVDVFCQTPSIDFPIQQGGGGTPTSCCSAGNGSGATVRTTYFKGACPLQTGMANAKPSGGVFSTANATVAAGTAISYVDTKLLNNNTGPAGMNDISYLAYINEGTPYLYACTGGMWSGNAGVSNVTSGLYYSASPYTSWTAASGAYFNPIWANAVASINNFTYMAAGYKDPVNGPTAPSYSNNNGLYKETSTNSPAGGFTKLTTGLSASNGGSCFTSVAGTGTNIFAGTWGMGVAYSPSSGSASSFIWANGLGSANSNAAVSTQLLADAGSVSSSPGSGRLCITSLYYMTGVGLFAGTPTGAWFTADTGHTWTQITTGYVNCITAGSVSAIPGTSTVFIGTENAGVTKMSITTYNTGTASQGAASTTVSATGTAVFTSSMSGGWLVYTSGANSGMGVRITSYTGGSSSGGSLVVNKAPSTGLTNVSFTIIMPITATQVNGNFTSGTLLPSTSLYAPTNPVTGLQVVRSLCYSNSTLYAGTPFGTYWSTDNGSDWYTSTYPGTVVQNQWVTDEIIDPNTTETMTAFFGSGYWTPEVAGMNIGNPYGVPWAVPISGYTSSSEVTTAYPAVRTQFTSYITESFSGLSQTGSTVTIGSGDATDGLFPTTIPANTPLVWNDGSYELITSNTSTALTVSGNYTKNNVRAVINPVISQTGAGVITFWSWSPTDGFTSDYNGAQITLADGTTEYIGNISGSFAAGTFTAQAYTNAALTIASSHATATPQNFTVNWFPIIGTGTSFTSAMVGGSLTFMYRGNQNASWQSVPIVGYYNSTHLFTTVNQGIVSQPYTLTMPISTAASITAALNTVNDMVTALASSGGTNLFVGTACSQNMGPSGGWTNPTSTPTAMDFDNLPTYYNGGSSGGVDLPFATTNYYSRYEDETNACGSNHPTACVLMTVPVIPNNWSYNTGSSMGAPSAPGVPVTVTYDINPSTGYVCTGDTSHLTAASGGTITWSVSGCSSDFTVNSSTGYTWAQATGGINQGTLSVTWGATACTGASFSYSTSYYTGTSSGCSASASSPAMSPTVTITAVTAPTTTGSQTMSTCAGSATPGTATLQYTNPPGAPCLWYRQPFGDAGFQAITAMAAPGSGYNTNTLNLESGYSVTEAGYGASNPTNGDQFYLVGGSACLSTVTSPTYTLTVNNAAPSTTNGMVSGDYAWAGYSSNDYTLGTNWLQWGGGSTWTLMTAANYPTATNNVFISNGTQTCPGFSWPHVSGSTHSLSNNLTVDAGAFLYMDNDYYGAAPNLTASGAIANYGTISFATYFSGSYPGGTLSGVGGFTNESGATFAFASSAATTAETLSDGGNFSNLGTFTQGLGTVNMDGTADQSFTTGGSGITLYNLTIDNTAAAGSNIVSLSDASGPANINVTNNLTLTAGFLSIGPYPGAAGTVFNNLILSKAVANFSNTSYIITNPGATSVANSIGLGENNIGYLQINGLGSGGALSTAAIPFPIGSSTSNFTPLSIANTSTNVSNFSAYVEPGVQTLMYPTNYAAATPLSVASPNSATPFTWYISSSAASPSANLTLYSNNLGANGFTIGTQSTIDHYTDLFGGVANGPGNASQAAGNVTGAGGTAFNSYKDQMLLYTEAPYIGEYAVLPSAPLAASFTTTYSSQTVTSSTYQILGWVNPSALAATTNLNSSQTLGPWTIPTAGGYFSQSVSGISTFSPFAISFKKSGQVALPITLLDFTATPIYTNRSVDLNWTTASETNNDYFTLFRSKDAINFDPFMQIPGAGTTSELHNYQEYDFTPYSGLSYYQLKQTDFDGKYTFSQIVPVNFDSNSGGAMSVFPSPASSQSINVKLNGLPANEQVLLVLLDVLGQTIYSKVTFSDPNGNMVESINQTQFLPAGVYTVVGSSQSAIYKQKIIVK